MIDMKKCFVKKIFTRSSMTTFASIAVMCGVITCVIAGAPQPSTAYRESGIPESEINRIEAPIDEVDTYARPAVAPTEDETVIVQSMSFESPEVTTAAETEPIVEPETTAPEPITTEPVITDANDSVTDSLSEPQETVSDETATAPESSEPVSDETQASETTAVEEAPAETQPAPAEQLYADKYKVKNYKIVAPEFEVSDYEIELAATVIQLEVMGSGSELDAFQDKTEKYIEMLSVAEVIRNRVDSNKFPSTVEEVILQKVGQVPQFSPRETLEYYNQFVTEGARAAAREALIVGIMVKPSNLCYFCATSIKAQFEEWNAAALVPDGNGSYVQWEGHLTTFYAGHINSDK